MAAEYLLYKGALAVFEDFSLSCKDFIISHDTGGNALNTLRKTYSLEKVAGEDREFAKAINVMRWVHDNVLHNGGTKDVEFIPKDAMSILAYSFGKGTEYGVYCRLQAIVFTECCLSLGMPARTIHCLPFSPNDFDSHVVSMVYICDYNKWVYFDPGNNAYFMDMQGVPLSPLEVRAALAADEIHLPDTLQPHYACAYEEKSEQYKQYMAKNMFYIKFSQNNTAGTDLIKDQVTYHLIPKGFDVWKREVQYCQYAICNTPDVLRKDWEDSLESFTKQRITTVSEQQFLQI